MFSWVETFSAHVPAWLMVLFRLSGIFLLAPLLGSRSTFRQVKVFLVLGLSLAVYPMLLDPHRASAPLVGHVIEHGVPFWQMVPMVALELLIGFAVGYAASLPVIGMQLGGHMISQQMSMSLAQIINPELGDQSDPMGEVMFMMAMAIFVALGGHNIMLAILIGSFDKIPLGGFNDFGGLVEFMLGLLSVTFELGVRIAAPLLCLMFLETLSLGFIARTMPQLNILSVGFALRIVVGLSCVILLLSTAAYVFMDTLDWMMRQLFGFFAQT